MRSTGQAVGAVKAFPVISYCQDYMGSMQKNRHRLGPGFCLVGQQTSHPDLMKLPVGPLASVLGDAPQVGEEGGGMQFWGLARGEAVGLFFQD
jgi:hypothetical protein